MRIQTGEGCLVAFYHYVRDVAATPFPALKALAPADFERQLDALAATHRLVGFEQFATALESRQSLDGAALLTFDDGFADHFTTVLPRLRARGMSGVFFVVGAALENPPRLLNVHRAHFLLAQLGAERFAREVRAALPGAGARHDGLGRQSSVYRYDRSDDLDVKHMLNYELPFTTADQVLSDMFTRHIGEESAFARALYLSADQIRGMADAGMTFGFHTERHRVLSRLDRAAQHVELARGVERIRALTGQSRVPMCYPYGHAHTYNADTLDLLGDAGYVCAFNTVRRRARLDRDPRYELPRFDTRDLPPFAPLPSHA